MEKRHYEMSKFPRAKGNTQERPTRGGGIMGVFIWGFKKNEILMEIEDNPN